MNNILEYSNKQASSGTKVMRVAAGWLINGKGDPALGNALLEVGQGIIQAIHRGDVKQEEIAVDTDPSSCTVLPGLMDCHVHLNLSGTEDASLRKSQLASPFEQAKERIALHLRRHLDHGIMAVRDGGDCRGHALRYKQTCLTAEREAPRVFSSGQAWHAPGRYGAMIGRTPAADKGLAGSIFDTETADLIKIINSGANSLSAFGRETPPQFSLQDLREAVGVGHSRGRKVMVHANGRLAVQSAIEAGCDSIEHGYFMGEENLRKMAERRISWVPTVFAMQALISSFEGTPAAETAKRNVDHQLDQIRVAMNFGVAICAGTDAGSMGVHHGRSLIEELRLLMSAGMSLERAVQCAASTASDLMGLPNFGRIEPGAPACLVVTKGGPELLPESLESAEWILS